MRVEIIYVSFSPVNVCFAWFFVKVFYFYYLSLNFRTIYFLYTLRQTVIRIEIAVGKTLIEIYVCISIFFLIRLSSSLKL